MAIYGKVIPTKSMYDIWIPQMSWTGKKGVWRWSRQFVAKLSMLAPFEDAFIYSLWIGLIYLLVVIIITWSISGPTIFKILTFVNSAAFPCRLCFSGPVWLTGVLVVANCFAFPCRLCFSGPVGLHSNLTVANCVPLPCRLRLFWPCWAAWCHPR